MQSPKKYQKNSAPGSPAFALSKDGGQRRSRSQPQAPPLPAEPSTPRRGLTHCRCSSANQEARLFPANHCRVALANHSVPVVNEERSARQRQRSNRLPKNVRLTPPCAPPPGDIVPVPRPGRARLKGSNARRARSPGILRDGSSNV